MTASSGPLTVRVAVGSTNPCKIEAVRKAFEEVFSKKNDAATERNGGPVKIVISSHSVPSGVSDQPFGDVETRLGAMNRAKAAYDAACAGAGREDSRERPDFAVGMEGGLEKLHNPLADPESRDQGDAPDELWCMAWMAILGSGSEACVAARAEGDKFSPDSNGTKSWGYAKTGSFLLPPALCELVIEKNMELGHADDQVFRRVNSKHGSGTVGILTDGEIDRANYYVHALKLALVPWVRPELYLS